MKHLLCCITATALLSMSATQLLADQTNLVQGVSFHLLGLKQGDTETNRNLVRTELDVVPVGTRAVIEALGAATSNTFSRAASLVLITPLAGGSPTLAIRDGGNSVDITAFFVVQTLSPSLTSSQLNRKTGRGWSIEYSVRRFALQDADGLPALSIHFDVTGLVLDSTLNDPECADSDTARSDVSGSGDKKGTFLIFQGSIRLQGTAIEIVPGGGGGPTTMVYPQSGSGPAPLTT